MKELAQIKEALKAAAEVYNEMDSLGWPDDSSWQHSSYEESAEANAIALTALQALHDRMESSIKKAVYSELKVFMSTKDEEYFCVQIDADFPVLVHVVTQAAIKAIKGE